MFYLQPCLELKSVFVEFWFYFVSFLSFYNPFTLFIAQPFYLFLGPQSNPLGLTNNMCEKHPIVLILSYFCLCFFNNKLPFIYTTLMFLGSYWSSNEFNWGGFWSFDFVETTLFFSYIYYIFIFHLLYFFKKNIFKWFFLDFALFFFFLKFTPTDSIHSFISSTPTTYFHIFTYVFFLFSHPIVYQVIIYYTLLFFLYSYKLMFLGLIPLIFYPQYFKYKKTHFLYAFYFFLMTFYSLKFLNQLFDYDIRYDYIFVYGSKNSFFFLNEYRFFCLLSKFSPLIFYTPYLVTLSNTLFAYYKLFIF